MTFRCLPCAQCAEFDESVVVGIAELDALLRQFISVRLVSMRAVDARFFPYAQYQDLDLSWWGYFHDGSSPIAVFGGRDEVSDATRISTTALANTMTRVLDSWAIRGAEEVDPTECLHCHQVAEILRQPAIDAGAFDKATDFWSWPLPENVGLTLDRDDGLLVTGVRADSPAAAIGLRSGDSLLGPGHSRGTVGFEQAGPREWTVLFGQADFRGVLQRSSRADEPATVDLEWTRNGVVVRGTLDLPPGWRETDLGWRLSVAEAAISANTGLPKVAAISPADRRRLGLDAGGLAVRPSYPGKPTGPAAQAGLRPEHVITAINGESPDLSERPFAVWFRLRFDPGDSVVLTVLERNGQTREVSYRAPSNGLSPKARGAR